MTFDDITAVLVTRGDVVMDEILDSLPYRSTVVWDNSIRTVDYGVFGRYIALAEIETPLAFFQDDDCIVHCHEELLDAWEPGYVVGNAFDDAERLKRYEGTTLLGWGSIFEADLPWKAFLEYGRHFPLCQLWDDHTKGLGAEIVFPMLTPSKTITHGVTWLDDGGLVLERKNRMWKHPTFYQDTRFWMERARLLL